MLALTLPEDVDELRQLTQTLLALAPHPSLERQRFEGTRERAIPGFAGDLLPAWGRVMVTGGTGCVGSVVLRRLRQDLPAAELESVARRLPVANRRIPGVRYAAGDVRDGHRMAALMRESRPDLVLHLAAQRDPAYAEDHVYETVSTNVLGSRVVLDAAAAAGVRTVVVASSGKAMRFFTSDVYAATKKLVESEAVASAYRHDVRIACARFTHVVDNSIVASKIVRWIADGEPVLLHSPHVMLPVQSALESYQLLMTAAVVAEPDRPKVVALRDLGWPPVSLLDLALDYLADSGSSSPISFPGHPQGYEAYPFPGTYDPVTAGDVSPLLNCAEAVTAVPTPVLGQHVDEFSPPATADTSVTSAIDVLCSAVEPGRVPDAALRDLLRSASIALVRHFRDHAAPDLVARIAQLGRRYDPRVADHALIAHELHAVRGSLALAGYPEE